MGSAMQAAGVRLYATMKMTCASLASDIGTAQAGPPIPYAAMQRLYGNALSRSVQCSGRLPERHIRTSERRDCRDPRQPGAPEPGPAGVRRHVQEALPGHGADPVSAPLTTGRAGGPTTDLDASGLTLAELCTLSAPVWALMRMNQYGGGAIIFGLERSEQSGAVDILVALNGSRSRAGQRRARLGRLTRVQEICPRAVRRRRFRDLPAGRFAVRRYTLTGSEGYMDAGQPHRQQAGGVSGASPGQSLAMLSLHTR